MKSVYFDVSVPKILATKALSKIFPSIYYSPLSPVSFGEIPERDQPGAGWVKAKSLLAGRLLRMGLKDEFVMDVAPYPDILGLVGLDAVAIAETVRSALK